MREGEVRNGLKPDFVVKVGDKVGLDTESGEFIVESGVTFRTIYARAEGGSNFGTASGYRISKLSRDKEGKIILADKPYVQFTEFPEYGREKTMIVTKKEAIQLISRYGCINAYITKKVKEEKDLKGNIIKKEQKAYIKPYPRNSFFKDGRGMTVYALDSEKRVAKPLKVILDLNECSKSFQKMIEEDMKKVNESHLKETRREEKSDNREKMHLLLSELQASGENIVNPFENIGIESEMRE